jgi:hypothetical protein
MLCALDFADVLKISMLSERTRGEDTLLTLDLCFLDVVLILSDLRNLFRSTKSIEGSHCAQVFFGMTSKMLYVARMKNDSEFSRFLPLFY